MAGSVYRGQTQKWVLLRYIGTDSDINIATKEPEFEKWKWMSIEQLVDLLCPLKKMFIALCYQILKQIIAIKKGPAQHYYSRPLLIRHLNQGLVKRI